MKVTRLLVVCSDNTCCSPLAEALLQRGAIGRGRRDIWVESASAAGFRGLPVCTLPLTARRRVSLIVTDLAVIEPSDAGLMLRKRAPGVPVEAILNATSARLIVPETVPEMQL